MRQRHASFRPLRHAARALVAHKDRLVPDIVVGAVLRHENVQLPLGSHGQIRDEEDLIGPLKCALDPFVAERRQIHDQLVHAGGRCVEEDHKLRLAQNVDIVVVFRCAIVKDAGRRVLLADAAHLDRGVLVDALEHRADALPLVLQKRAKAAKVL